MEDLEAKQKEAEQAAAEAFKAQSTLTEQEQEAIEKLRTDGTDTVVVVNTDMNGHKTQQDVAEYTKKIDDLNTVIDFGDKQIKAINQGDIRKTVDDVKAEAKTKAITAFRTYSIAEESEDMTDDDILAINDSAIRAIQEYCGVNRVDSDKIIKKLSKMPLPALVAILPKDFVRVYVSQDEITYSNYKAKERLLSTLAYLMATGPELDYLNDYIEHEHAMMSVSQEMIKAEMSITDVLGKSEKMSEIVSRAAKIVEQKSDEAVWSKFITDPKRVHNEFAQRAVVCEEYKAAYEKLLEEHQGDDKISLDARAMIQEQIDECDKKHEAYLSVTNLELFKSLWAILYERITNSKKNSYKNLVREAVSAIDRMRKSKQNIPFPVTDEKSSNRPEILYKKFQEVLHPALRKYNEVIDHVSTTIDEADGNYGLDRAKSNISPIHVEGVDDEVVFDYFAIMMLIIFGRIMKKLGDRGSTKYDAIMLDSYFRILCEMMSDIYITSDIWEISKDLIIFCIKNYPDTTTKKSN